MDISNAPKTTLAPDSSLDLSASSLGDASSDPARLHRRAPAAWSRRASTACTVAGAACLWAWGYVANLSASLFPEANVVASIGIEFGYYASQLTLLVFGLILVVAVRRRQPTLPPAAVVGSALTLGASALATYLYLCSGATSPLPIVACGAVNGAAGMLLTVAWGARFSLGSRAMRRMVLLSFLAGYAIYLVNLSLPHTMQTCVAVALPCVSGALWLLDSWRRHLLTSEVWPVAGTTPAPIPAAPTATRAGADTATGSDLRPGHPGEAAAGSTSVSILPWKTMTLISTAAFVGNFVTAFLMGATYTGAQTIFPGAFIVVGCIACATLLLVGDGSRPLSVEKLYRYDLPFAVLGMLLAMVAPAQGSALAGALVSGSSLFLQALVVLKVTETTQETGTSPMLSFAVGQGLVGGVVFAGNMGGRIASDLTGTDAGWLTLICALGVFALFYQLVMYANGMAEALNANCGGTPRDESEAADVAMPAPEGGPAAFATRGAAFAGHLGLTARETDVLDYLLRGRSLSAIAERLFVTAGTVKTHTLHIYRKAGVGSRQELIDLFEGTSWE